jgi:hypothetical protein
MGGIMTAPGPRLSVARQTSDALLELACLADETATRPAVTTLPLTPADRRALRKLANLARALVRASVDVQLVLAPYLDEEDLAA